MPIYFPEDFHESEPWDRVINWFKKQKDGSAIFQRGCTTTSHFIICRWEDDEPKKLPKWWLRKFHHIYSDWKEFGDQTIVEDPLHYNTLATALRRILTLRKSFPRVGLAHWVHPEAHYSHQDKHWQTVGIEFPGSPTQ